MLSRGAAASEMTTGVVCGKMPEKGRSIVVKAAAEGQTAKDLSGLRATTVFSGSVRDILLRVPPSLDAAQPRLLRSARINQTPRVDRPQSTGPLPSHLPSHFVCKLPTVFLPLPCEILARCQMIGTEIQRKPSSPAKYLHRIPDCWRSLIHGSQARFVGLRSSNLF